MISEQKFLVSFGKRIASIRKERGITQEKLADMVEVHRTYIGFIEQGKRNPSVKNVYKITKALNINLSELFKPFK